MLGSRPKFGLLGPFAALDCGNEGAPAPPGFVAVSQLWDRCYILMRHSTEL
jgi:hypothetical protein